MPHANPLALDPKVATDPIYQAQETNEGGINGRRLTREEDMQKCKDKIIKLKDIAKQNVENEKKVRELTEENGKLRLKVQELEEKKEEEKKAEEKGLEILKIKKEQNGQFKDDYILLWKKISSLKNKIELACQIHNHNPTVQLELAKKDFETFVTKFNELKKQWIDIKILDQIIEVNKAISANNNKESDLISSLNELLYKFNSISNEFKDCSNKLKEMLIAIYPDDARLPATGTFTKLFNSYTKSRIFTLPGGENLQVDEKTVELPIDWEYVVSEIYVKKEEAKPQPENKDQESDANLESQTK